METARRVNTFNYNRFVVHICYMSVIMDSPSKEELRDILFDRGFKLIYKDSRMKICSTD